MRSVERMILDALLKMGVFFQSLACDGNKGIVRIVLFRHADATEVSKWFAEAGWWVLVDTNTVIATWGVA